MQNIAVRVETFLNYHIRFISADWISDDRIHFIRKTRAEELRGSVAKLQAKKLRS